MRRAARGSPRAVLELLRAPLLLSPAADVIAGWVVAWTSVAHRVTSTGQHPLPAAHGWPALLVAALTGTCLLAAGMTLNGLVDLPEDRRRKPDRPLPRGALSARSAWWLWALSTLGALSLAASLSREVLGVAASIVLLSALYHAGWKRLRLPGCLTLGAARGLDLALGGLAFAAVLPDPAGAAEARAMAGVDTMILLAAALAYGLYMFGASLHASTDDEGGGAAWSRAGLSVCGLMLLAPAVAGLAVHGPAASSLFSIGIAGWALTRLAYAWRRLSAPVVTGVALSGLYLFHASLCLSQGALAWGPLGAGLVLALFAGSRLLLRSFPPT
jgi:4-hydroxybenzoate polyprenyltransferase